ncbi:transporter substrate-binding domain-containing protein [Aliiglaciecola sp. 3_MG-2023]|uniref:substrate-binding periplasmic protein n=1 Tax=Aliiglaciecola sp. 3_MG-2023 TaxID=3062644 RepID=UPI0026E21BE6|nr:transporter substrate-binding domain-containing protein [Aliiglaciecola sp. 3_MG-2023]MDO6692117.1 transporter substrate-binding domain-containing protein [Aliiglaciecola sp. 3_MG-2023]
MKIAVCVWVTLSLVFLPSYVLADTLVSHCRDYPPDLYFNGKKCIGILPELVEDVLSELGHDVDWVYAPWIRSTKEAKRGNVDLLVRHSMTKKRQTFLKPIKYAVEKRTLYFYKSKRITEDVTSYEQLEKLSIGAIRGVFYSPNFAKIDSNTLTLVGKTEQLVGMLDMARIDIVVTSSSHNSELFEGRFDKVTFEDSFYNHHYISIPLKSKAIIFYDDIARVMLRYRKTGKINQYYEKYGVPPPYQDLSEIDGN